MVQDANTKQFAEELASGLPCTQLLPVYDARQRDPSEGTRSPCLRPAMIL